MHSQRRKAAGAFHADLLGQVVPDVVCHVQRELGRVLAPAQRFHLLRKFQDHVVLQIHDLAVAGQQLHPLDVGVGEGEGVVFPVFKGTFVFVSLMVLGLGMLYAGLCALSAKLKKPALIALFLFSFVCSLGMGYLSTRDFAQASMNWIAQGVNVVGQGAMLAGVLLLHRGGLAALVLQKEEKR